MQHVFNAKMANLVLEEILPVKLVLNVNTKKVIMVDQPVINYIQFIVLVPKRKMLVKSICIFTLNIFVFMCCKYVINMLHMEVVMLALVDEDEIFNQVVVQVYQHLILIVFVQLSVHYGPIIQMLQLLYIIAVLSVLQPGKYHVIKSKRRHIKRLKNCFFFSWLQSKSESYKFKRNGR